MSILGEGYALLLAVFSNRYVLATLTLCGMVLTVLGAFSVIDAVRMPRKFGRNGLPLVPLFDEIVIVRGAPWQPLEGNQHVTTLLLSGALSGAIGAASFAVVIGIGYRHGYTGAVVGAGLGLGLGLAVALRPAMSWLAGMTRLTLDLVVVRVMINVTTYFIGLAVFNLLLFVAFLLVFLVLLILWVVLLPWLVFVWIVRRVRHQPSNTTALVAPFALVAMLPAVSEKARKRRAWRDPENKTLSARVTRWVLPRLPELQKYVVGIIVGNVYAVVGQHIVADVFQSSGELYLLVGVLVLFGFGVGRIFELAVESLYFLDFDGFVSNGPATLDGLRVGLVTGLSLGAIVGLAPKNGIGLQVTGGLLHGFLVHDWTGATLAIAIALAVSVVPDIIGWFAPSFVDWTVQSLRFVHIRTAMGIGGLTLVLVGIGLQLLQYVALSH